MREYTSKPAPGRPFKVDGVTFTPGGSLPMLDLVELAGLADVEHTSPEGIIAVGNFFKSLFGDDYARFAEHTRKHHTDPATLFEIMTDIVQDVVAGVPLASSSPSSNGRGNTASTSRAASRSRATAAKPTPAKRAPRKSRAGTG